MAKKKQSVLRVTMRKSPIGYSKRQKNTVRALGLKKINQTVTLKDNDAVRGMIFKVSHLVEVEEGEA